MDVCDTPSGCAGAGADDNRHGHVVVYGDSSCLDEWSAAGGNICAPLLQAMVQYAVTGKRNRVYFPDRTKQGSAFQLDDVRGPPARRPDNELYKYSNVIGGPGAAQSAPRAGSTCDWQQWRTKKISK